MFDGMWTRSLGRHMLWMAFGIAAASSASNAIAGQACDGSYVATSLQALPANAVVGVDIRDRAPRNLRLAEQFLAGVREAGHAVGDQPNVILHVTTSVTGDGTSQSSRASERSYPDLSGLPGGSVPGGGMQMQLPGATAFGASRGRSGPARQMLFLRVEASQGGAARTSWIASVQCQIIGFDENALALELGRVIGGALGKRVERRPI